MKLNKEEKMYLRLIIYSDKKAWQNELNEKKTLWEAEPDYEQVINYYEKQINLAQNLQDKFKL